jgi:hypothetical protein
MIQISLSKIILGMNLAGLVEGVFLTDFAQRITQLWDSDPPLQMRCRIDDSSCDIPVNLGSGVVFQARPLVLGVSFPLSNALRSWRLLGRPALA